MKIKEQGQVFTPKHIVDDILDIAGYKGKNILNKHVIDNSCGDGAFLVEIIKRYIKEYFKINQNLEKVEEHLEKYIHGIEKDKDIYIDCINNLKSIEKKYGLKQINWDVINKDTLRVEKYDRKMDYVIGNPPYVRVHNLKDQFNNVKSYSFCNSGMTDLYLVFFEIGIRMLNKDGILCYITPNSFCNSLAGTELRKYLQKTRTLECLYDLGHYQPFDVNTYTIISKIHKEKDFNICKYFKYDSTSEKANFICNINYSDLFVNDNIILSPNNKKYFKYLQYEVSNSSKVQVKNGFATLNDKFFIKNTFEFKNNIIDVIKGSTGQWKKCIYPYDENGKIVPFNNLENKMQRYYNENKKDLDKDSKDGVWYGFGRTQAIKDVNKKKIAINTTIKDIDSIKINEVEEGQGVYSGLYMITDIPIDIIREKICCENFINYLKVINKCKSGGYLTFSSKDLARYINYELEDYNE